MDTEALFTQFDFQGWYLNALVDDIAEDQMTSQPGLVVNHPAWQIGHLAWVSDNAVMLAGGTKTLDKNWDAQFAPKTQPVADRAAYASKAELLSVLAERRAAIVTQCKTLSDAQWKEGHPIERLQKSLPTRWNLMHFLMLTHESTHLGQLAVWRRATGLPMALSIGQPK